MNNIEEKLARKKMELTAATNEQERKWAEFQHAEKTFRNRYQIPWHQSLERQQAIVKEIAILEGVLNEMAAA